MHVSCLFEFKKGMISYCKPYDNLVFLKLFNIKCNIVCRLLNFNPHFQININVVKVMFKQGALVVGVTNYIMCVVKRALCSYEYSMDIYSHKNIGLGFDYS